MTSQIFAVMENHILCKLRSATYARDLLWHLSMQKFGDAKMPFSSIFQGGYVD